MKSIWTKVFVNKKTGQASVSLSKKKLAYLFKEKYPRRIKIRLEEWDEE